MKVERLLGASTNIVGPYQTVDDWQDITIQIASSANKPFKGTVTIEGTLDIDQETILWSVLLESVTEAVLKLSGYALAGVRATTSRVTGGEVVVLVSGH